MHQLDSHYAHADGRRQYAYDRGDPSPCCGCDVWDVWRTHAEAAACECRCHDVARIVASFAE
jgi:hypothetical protein